MRNDSIISVTRSGVKVEWKYVELRVLLYCNTIDRVCYRQGNCEGRMNITTPQIDLPLLPNTSAVQG